MQKLSENIFLLIQGERGKNEAIAEFFFLVPEHILEKTTFSDRLNACMHAEKSNICRCLPEMQLWLVEAVVTENDCEIASGHVFCNEAKYALVQKKKQLIDEKTKNKP